MAYSRSGKENGNYKGGNSACIDCKKLLSYRSLKPKRCRTCYFNFSKGSNHPHWKGGIGFPNCINCLAKTGDFNSILCKNCYKGALHPLWRGGTSSLSSLIRATKENRQFIKQSMYRDKYCCQECGEESTGNNLQVHHIKQFAQIIKENNIKTIEDALKCEELWDNDNGVTLCRKCHKLTESYNKKVN